MKTIPVIIAAIFLLTGGFLSPVRTEDALRSALPGADSGPHSWRCPPGFTISQGDIHYSAADASGLTCKCRDTQPLPQIEFSPRKVFCQPDLKQTMHQRITPASAFHLGGVHIDTRGERDRFYVLDSGNNRILGFDGNSAVVTDPSHSGPFPPADIVIGQPSAWDCGAANWNNTEETNPTAATLAVQPYPYTISMEESPRSMMMATDSDRNLYVVDFCNNRVLRYDDPFGTDQVADEVWGQIDFTSRGTPEIPAASSLKFYYNGTDYLVFSAGVEVDGDRNVWITDTFNHRVLRFSPGQKEADIVLGQSAFDTNYYTGAFDRPLDRMAKPISARMHPSTGALYVLEGECAGHCRILVFAPPFSTGMSATREIGRALDRLDGSQPSPGEGWEYICFTDGCSWMRLASGLHWGRGFAFDPGDDSRLWISDGGNNRIICYDIDTGGMVDVIGQPDYDSRDCNFGYVRYNGRHTSFYQPDGEIGFDRDGNMYMSHMRLQQGIARIPLPLRRDEWGRVLADGQLLKEGWNTVTGRTSYHTNEVRVYGGQLFSASGHRVMVWNDYESADDFPEADYVLGQPGLEWDDSPGAFGGGVSSLCVGNGLLFATSGYSIFVFKLPITSNWNGEEAFPLLRVLQSGRDVTWEDDGATVSFWLTGMAYDDRNDILWVSDYPRNRVLRIRHPLDEAKVDLVIGQESKEGDQYNYGRGLMNPDARSIAAPWNLELSPISRNLYVVESAYEGRLDSAGNLRVSRFDAADILPVPGNIFPLPAAGGVFCKPTLETNREWRESHRPNVPVNVAFDEYNRMFLFVDSYSNLQYERAYFYPFPDSGAAPEPEKVIPIAIGQPASAVFAGGNRLIYQDHTWNRILFLDLDLPPGPSPPATATSTPAPAATPTPESLEGKIGIFRPSSGLWAFRDGQRVYFGGSGDVPVLADYTGDGTKDLGIYRESSGLWAIRGVTRAYFGASGDRPVPGDYTGDSTVDLAIFRGSNGLWAAKGGTRAYFGGALDTTVPGDYSGTGTAQVAIFRPASGLWAVRGVTRAYFGSSGDTPVPGDYSGDDTEDMAIFQERSGLWAVRNGERIYFGGSGNIPVPGDYLEDGRDRAGVFLGTSGLWAIRGVTRTYFGAAGDVPVTR